MTKPVSLALAASAVLLLTAGCSAGKPTMSELPRSSPTPSVSLPQTPADALAKGGLRLPVGAEDARFTSVDGTLWRELYRVSFTLPLEESHHYCQSVGLGGPLPPKGLTPQDKELLGPDVTGSTGSWICKASDPNNAAWNRIALVSDTNPATVWVTVAKMGR